MNTESAIYLGVAGLVMVVAAFLLGRRTGGNHTRQLELEAELTTAQSEQARSAAEAERLRNDLDAHRQEYDEYRLNVVDHFSGTSDLLRDLTVQYRSVYEHLTSGASKLCPEGFVGLTEGLPTPQLAESRSDVGDWDTGSDSAADVDEDESELSAAADGPEDSPKADVSLSASAESDESAESRADTDEPDPDETLSVPAIPA